MNQVDIINSFEKIDKENTRLNNLRDALMEERRGLDERVKDISRKIEDNGAKRQPLAKECQHTDSKGNSAYEAFSTSLYQYCRYCKAVR